MDMSSNSRCLFLTLNKSVCGAAGTLFSKQKWNPVWLPQVFIAQGSNEVPLPLDLRCWEAEPPHSHKHTHTVLTHGGQTQAMGPRLPL